MYRNLSTIALFFVTIYSSHAGINFSPAIEEYTSQGFVYRKVSLKEDKGVITFVTPLGWEVRGTKDLLQFKPNKNFAEASISASPLKSKTTFDAPTVEALKQQALLDAPSTSQKAEIVRCELNPISMGPYSSLEIAISYQTLGRTFEKSVLFVQARDVQLIFRLTAPKEVYGPLSAAFRTSIGSWQWPESKPSEPLTASK